jgi:uncharacterized protein (DUF433 family)
MAVKTPRTVHLSARVPKQISDDLKEFASRHGIPVSGALSTLLGEALKMALHPGIDFRFVPGGRSAFVTGTGLRVWELLKIWEDHRRDIRRVLRNYPHLKRSQVAAGVRYAEAYPDETAREVRKAQPDQPLEVFPFLSHLRV